ncbi:MAG: hypothetical protein ABIQ16_11175 [Polyangiaceae bacterium]
MNPLDSPFGQSGQTIADGALVAFAASGPPGSLLPVDTPTAAKLTFEGRFIDRVRAQGDGDETRTLAPLDGQLQRSKGTSPTLVFTGNAGSDGGPDGLVPDEAIDEDSDPEDDDNDDPTEVRVLRFQFASDQFANVNADPTADTNELLVHIDPTSFHYLEVSVKLEIAGAIEAPSAANDVLDVLITSQNPGHHTLIGLRLTDQTGSAVASAACQIVSGARPAEKGADPSALTADGDGIIRLKTDPAATECEVKWGTAGSTDFPFTRTIFLVLGDDQEQAHARRLINLGYPETESLEDNVFGFQADFARPATGRLRDIAADLRALHDDGVTPPLGSESEPDTEAIALNSGPTDAPDALRDDADASGVALA